jgi:protein-S-isoprenylcysteine O-methyltransferase Ste14
MHARTPVEIADRISRKRAIGVAAAALVFLLVQVVVHPFFSGADPGGRARTDVWAINAIVLLLLLATGGGLLNRREIRALVNDEVSRSHYKTSVVAGFWVAMTTAMGLYLMPPFRHLTARETAYVIVTASISVALLAFAYLEYRAHRDG